MLASSMGRRKMRVLCPDAGRADSVCWTKTCGVRLFGSGMQVAGDGREGQPIRRRSGGRRKADLTGPP